MTPQFVHAIVTYGPRFVKDLSLDVLKVCGMFGNFGVECAEFTAMQERGYNGRKDSKGNVLGGWSWPQWTGPRRRAFEAWADSNGFKRDDPEATYRYLLIELRGPEKAALTALRATKTLDTATTVFGQKFERPADLSQSLKLRKKHALDALHILEAAMSTSPAPSSAPFIAVDPLIAAAPFTLGGIASTPAPAAPMPAFEANAIRDRLVALGYHVAGLPDGVLGDRIRAGLEQLQATVAKRDPSVVVTGVYDDATKAMLADDANKAIPSPLRDSVTANDLAAVKNPGVTGGRAITMANVMSAVTGVAGFVVALQQGWQANPQIPWYAQTIMGFLPPWVLPLVPIAFNVYTIAKSRGIIDQAVQRVRQGIDNTGLPAAPATAAPALPFGLDKLRR